jgi:hypothetical protein
MFPPLALRLLIANLGAEKDGARHNCDQNWKNIFD